MKGNMIIDGHKVEFDGEKNLLEVIRKTGIDLPTFCYHSELSVYGGCRMCIVEDRNGRILASCSTSPKDGLEINTSTPKLRKYRRMNLELILSNHDRDCTICEKNGKCKLQDLATRFGVKRTRFISKTRRLPIDTSNPSIVRDPNKCIMCGDCVRMCKEIQGIGILHLDLKGEKLKVDANSDGQPGKSGCVNCGQCTTVCPTGALIVKNDAEKVWNVLQDESKRVVAQVAPAVRVGIGEEFGRVPSENMLGKIAAALRKLGFDAVYDMAFSADLTTMEESKELMERLESGEKLPMFTSCCPSWVKFVEQKYPELLGNLSSCSSPQQISGRMIKKHYNERPDDSKETIVVSIVPCTAKKMEAQRPEYSKNGVRDVDIVITTQELVSMTREAGIIFNELEQEAMDNPFGLISGAGVIFGVTGGVTEAVLRNCCSENNPIDYKMLSMSGVRGMGGLKELSVEINGKMVNIAVVHGLRNVDEMISKILNGEKSYHFVEVMSCIGGCVGGAGQPIPCSSEIKVRRAAGIYNVDKVSQIKSSDENPIAFSYYNKLIKNGSNILHNEKKPETVSINK